MKRTHAEAFSSHSNSDKEEFMIDRTMSETTTGEHPVTSPMSDLCQPSSHLSGSSRIPHQQKPGIYDEMQDMVHNRIRSSGNLDLSLRNSKNLESRMSQAKTHSIMPDGVRLFPGASETKITATNFANSIPIAGDGTVIDPIATDYFSMPTMAQSVDKNLVNDDKLFEYGNLPLLKNDIGGLSNDISFTNAAGPSYHFTRTAESQSQPGQLINSDPLFHHNHQLASDKYHHFTSKNPIFDRSSSFDVFADPCMIDLDTFFSLP